MLHCFTSVTTEKDSVQNCGHSITSFYDMIWHEKKHPGCKNWACMLHLVHEP